MKVLHLPTSVGGHSWGLAQGERALGLDSKVLITEQNWLNYQFDYCLHLENRYKPYKVYKLLKTFFEIRSKYDIFHFNFGSSLLDFPSYNLNLIDLPFYKGKMIMTYNGCDARQKYPTIRRVDYSACHEKDCYGGICTQSRDHLRQKRIEKVSKYVEHIFAVNPDLMYFLPIDKTTFLPYAVAGWDEIERVDFKLDKKIKILHSPTNREAKGTKYILSALERLKGKFNNIEIIIVEKVPYQKALSLYREAHIVIDQVLIGWYGGFGVEVMKMGKPLAVFIREEDLKFIPQDMAKDLREAIININPFNIVEVIMKYIENPKLLYQKSIAGLEYVYKWHDPKYVASITKSVYEKIF